MALIAFSGSYVLTRMADQGLADFAGLKTLRCGTDPLTWLQVHLCGIKPDLDGSTFCKIFGKERGFALAPSSSEYGVTLPKITISEETLSFLPKRVAALFASWYTSFAEYRMTKFVWNGIQKAYPILEWTPAFYLFKKTMMHGIPISQKFVATLNLIHKVSPIESAAKATIAIGAAFFSCLTPAIKVRLKETDKLENPTSFNILLLAQDNISIFNLGLLGTLKNGGFPPLFSKPGSVITGACQLALAGGIGYGAGRLFPGFVAAHRTALIAGAILAAV